jgi:hypothetical protein
VKRLILAGAVSVLALCGTPAKAASAYDLIGSDEAYATVNAVKLQWTNALASCASDSRRCLTQQYRTVVRAYRDGLDRLIRLEETTLPDDSRNSWFEGYVEGCTDGSPVDQPLQVCFRLGKAGSSQPAGPQSARRN